MIFIVNIQYTDGAHDCVFFNQAFSAGCFVADRLEEKNVAKIEVLTEAYEIKQAYRDAALLALAQRA